jgi:hypothetical protein
MGQEDAAIWERFLGAMPQGALGVDYDLRVGPGLPVDAAASGRMQRDWLLLTQLRLDAVVYFPASVWIVEIKPRLLPSALGQLLAYGFWFQRDVPAETGIKLVALVERSDEQLQPVFQAFGVTVLRA